MYWAYVVKMKRNDSEKQNQAMAKRRVVTRNRGCDSILYNDNDDVGAHSP